MKKIWCKLCRCLVFFHTKQNLLTKEKKRKVATILGLSPPKFLKLSKGIFWGQMLTTISNRIVFIRNTWIFKIYTTYAHKTWFCKIACSLKNFTPTCKNFCIIISVTFCDFALISKMTLWEVLTHVFHFNVREVIQQKIDHKPVTTCFFSIFSFFFIIYFYFDPTKYRP